MKTFDQWLATCSPEVKRMTWFGKKLCYALYCQRYNDMSKALATMMKTGEYGLN